MIPRLTLIAYGVAAVAAIGVGWYVIDLIGDRREASVMLELEEERQRTQQQLDDVQDLLVKTESENRALAARLNESRKGLEDAIRADPNACRLPSGLRRQLEQRWAEEPPR